MIRCDNLVHRRASRGERRTKIEMLAYSLFLFPLSLAPYFTGIAGPVYLTGAAILSGLFIVCALRVLRDRLKF